MEEAIFNEIKNDSAIATKLADGASGYHIYPLRVPDNVQFTKAVTYTEITQNLIYPVVRNSVVQINCIAKDFSDAIELSADIDRIFNDKAEYKMGGKLSVNYTKFSGRNSYFDPTSQMYIIAVEISIKF